MATTHYIRFSIVALTVAVFTAHGYQEGQPLRFGISGMVESNDNRDATESDKNSTLDIFLRPYIAYHVDAEATRIHLRYQPGLRYRTEPGDNQDEVDLQHAATLQIQHAFSLRSRGRLSNTFTKIDDPKIEGGPTAVIS
ncbi:MAG: hypothetical protein ACNA71_01910 [Kiritimatiellia bacterium]